MASAGSPEKSAGSAAFNLGVVEDMGVAVGVEGVAGIFGGAGGNTCCRWGLGLLEGVEVVEFQGDAGFTVEVEGRGGGAGDLSSSLELSKSLKAPELQEDDMLGGESCT